MKRDFISKSELRKEKRSVQVEQIVSGIRDSVTAFLPLPLTQP